MDSVRRYRPYIRQEIKKLARILRKVRHCFLCEIAHATDKVMDINKGAIRIMDSLLGHLSCDSLVVRCHKCRDAIIALANK